MVCYPYHCLRLICSVDIIPLVKYVCAIASGEVNVGGGTRADARDGVFFKVVVEGDGFGVVRENDIGFGANELDIDLIGTASVSNESLGKDGRIKEFGCANGAGDVISSRGVDERTNLYE